MQNKKYRIRPHEEDQDYKYRIYSYKDTDNLSWAQITKIINDNLGCNKVKGTYFNDYKHHYYDVKELETTSTVHGDTYAEELQDLILKYKKERIKLSDERIQNNAYIRKLSREETLKDIALSVAEKMTEKKLLDFHRPICYEDTGKEAILMISDWHYGIQIDNYWNVFNPDVCVKRVNRLKAEVLRLHDQYNFSRLHVVNLGDLISGRIHSQIRIENREDVISQTIHVSEILAELLTDLSEFVETDYYDCLDNHSRLEPNKKESLNLESLVRIIPWYLRSRLKGSAVTIHTNTYCDDIIDFYCLGHHIAGVHGHKDRVSTVIDRLSGLCENRFDLITTAHNHHFAADEKNKCVVVSNSSLMGTDNYSVDLRLSATPSQNLIVVTADNVTESIHRIILD